MLSYCSLGEIEIIYCVHCNNNIKYVCNSCNHSYKQIREFKRVECSTKNELRRNNPSPSHVFYLEQGSADDTSQNRHGYGDHDYDYLPKYDLSLEQDIADDTNPSKYDMDANETCSVIMQSKDIYDLIEKTNWGSEQSMKYFQMESKTEHAGIWSVVSNTTKQHELTSSNLDYHLLGAALCNNLPQKS
jgi:hypothetical protein